jgi:hypothetical protein
LAAPDVPLLERYHLCDPMHRIDGLIADCELLFQNGEPLTPKS